jgi:hypothetical protein
MAQLTLVMVTCLEAGTALKSTMQTAALEQFSV